MANAQPSFAVEDLLHHAEWMRRLARRLVEDEAAADDLVQEAWLAALSAPPRDLRNPRGWLASVLGNRAKDRARSSARRQQRERGSARTERMPSELEVFEEASRAQDVAAEVLALDEPYRTVLLLRFWRDRTPTEIARELGRPVTTVKTQLARGLERLRERLERRYGSREAWVTAVLPLCRGPLEATGAAALGAGTVGVAVAGAALAGLGWWAATRGDHTPPDGEERAPAALVGGSTADRTPLSSVASDEQRERASVRERMAPSGAAPPPTGAGLADEGHPFRMEGRVVDLDGRPVPGLEVVWNDPAELRWADEERTVLSGENVWIPVSSAVRDDPDAWEAFVAARLPDREWGMALLAGTSPPRRAARTDANGRYELGVPRRSRAVDVDHTTLGGIGNATLSDELGGGEVLVVARRRDLSGRVFGPQGAGVPDVSIQVEPSSDVEWSEAFARPPRLAPVAATGRTDERGVFLIEDVPLAGGAVVRATSAPDGLSVSGAWREARLEDAIDVRRLDGLDLRLWPSGPVWNVRGVVRTHSGSPAPRATVYLGGLAARTDSAGAYRFELPRTGPDEDDVDGRRSLAAQMLATTRSGSGIAELSLAPYVPPEGWYDVHLPDVHLPARALAIEGVVLGLDGRPRAGARVILWGTSQARDRSESLEFISAGRGIDPVLSDEHGRFRVEGLADKRYQLTARLESEASAGVEAHAGERGVQLILRR